MANTARQVEFLLTGYRNPSTDEPLSGGKVYTYLDGTTTESNLYTDRDQSAEAANPVVLDSSGRAEVYGDNVYKFEIYDSTGTHIETLNGIDLSRNTRIFVQSTQPTNEESEVGDLWVDTT